VTALSDECEYCDNQAVGQVRLQWTLFDYMSFQVCEKHINPVIRNWVDVRIEGEPLVDAYFTRWSE